MTICIAIKCKKEVEKKELPAVLFASDSQESSSYVKRSVTKLRIAPSRTTESGKDCSMVIASAGDALVADEAIYQVVSFIYGEMNPETIDPSTFLRIKRGEIGDIIYNVYKKYKDRGSESIFELLIGAADEFSEIMEVTYEGKTRLLDRFGIIGSGGITGGELLLNEFISDEMTVNEAAQLAALVVKTVGHVDIHVGGIPNIYSCSQKTTWEYKKEIFTEMLSKTESRWSLLREMWFKMQKDGSFEDKLHQLLTPQTT